MNEGTMVGIAGWTGTAFILTAYGLMSFGWLGPQDFNYQALNVAGTLGIGIQVYHKRAWAAFGLQCAWGAIALAAIARMWVG